MQGSNPLNQCRFTHVLWDWNGTLVDDAPLCHDIIHRMMERRGMPPLSLEGYREIYGHPSKLIYSRAGFDLDKEPYDVLAHEWFEGFTRCVSEFRLHSDTVSTVTTLTDAGVVQAILSALPHGVLNESVQRFGIEQYFTIIRGLDDISGHSKIDNGIELMRTLDADPARTVLVGDSTHDWEAASAIGAKCILVCQGHESRTRLESTGAPVVTSLQEALAIIMSAA